MQLTKPSSQVVSKSSEVPNEGTNVLLRKVTIEIHSKYGHCSLKHR